MKPEDQLRTGSDQRWAWMGYLLFAGALTYAFAAAPPDLWRIDLKWLLLAAAAVCLMLALQVLQFAVFVRRHGIRPDLLLPTVLTLRRGILNALLPAKAGTLATVHLVTRHYSLPWHCYVRFTIIAAAVTLGIALLALAGLLLPLPTFVLTVLCAVAIGIGLMRCFRDGYLRDLPVLAVFAAATYGASVVGFWSVLRGVGFPVSLAGGCYFAVASSALGVLMATPGNLGIREVLLGTMSPYLAIPPAAGIVAGAVLMVIRLTVSALALLFLEHGRVLPMVSASAADRDPTSG